MRKGILTSSAMLTLGLSLLIIVASNYNINDFNSIIANEKQLGAKDSPIVADDFLKKLDESYSKVSSSVLKSVVSIDVEVNYETQIPKGMEEFFKFFGEPNLEGEERRRMGSGSGVIITDDGYIVTNNHVIDNAIENGITVTINDKRKFKAKLIGADPLTDLALIKIDADDLSPAHFASMEDVKVGNIVLAVGSPLGLNATVTSGIVSAISRGSLGLLGRGMEGGNYSIENFIQTDAPINPGNSGGGLFNINGSLVGINTAIASQTGAYIGYGFAIPIDLVKSVISDLMEDGKVNRGYIGVQISPVDQKYAKALGLESVKGVLVNKVIPNSAAESAGLKDSDVILSVDSKEVNSPGELQNQIGLRRAGDKVKLGIWRDNELIFKDVTLKPRDGEDISSNENTNEEKTNLSFEKLGFEVESLTKDLKEKYEIEGGVLVTKVERYSEAQKSGLSVGTIIYKADKQKINSPKDLKTIINKMKEGDAFLLQVYIQDRSAIIAMEIPKIEG